MTEKVQHIINDIRLKSKLLHNRLISERERSSRLEVELKEVISQSELFKINNTELNHNITNLKSELETILKNEIDSQNSIIENRDNDIDNLVREIEHCINQLKK